MVPLPKPEGAGRHEISRFEPGTLQWYMALGTAEGMSKHCPYATLKRCPRYYQSIDLVGEVGIAVPMTEEATLDHLRYWKASDLWPHSVEMATYVTESAFSNFCPEVTLRYFDVAADHLASHGDEFDKEARHSRLKGENVPAGSPRWAWDFRPQHYSECSLYSILSLRNGQVDEIRASWISRHAGAIISALLLALGTIIAAYVTKG